jgi:uncharacterized protein YjbI with pentapeptide repeats
VDQLFPVCREEAETDDGCCLFHNPSLEKDLDRMQKRLEERLSAAAPSTVLYFSRCIFPEGIRFDRLDFKGPADFSEAEFYGHTNFSRSVFEQGADFGGARFNGSAVFAASKFGGRRTSFIITAFRSETHFISARFQSRLTDFSSWFRNKAFFDRAEFHGRVLFGALAFNPEYETSFGAITVSERGSLIFDGTDLSRTSFIGSDFKRATFLNVKWDRPRSFRAGRWRACLHDETLWRDGRRSNLLGSSVELLRLYRAIVAYYRDSQENRLLGQFYYGLMELEWNEREGEFHWSDVRLVPPEQIPSRMTLALKLCVRKVRKWFSFESLYRYSCGYGEDYAQAILVLILLILVFACVYYVLGSSSFHQAPEVDRALAAILFSFQTASLGKLHYAGNDIGSPSLGFEAIYTVESIVVPAQIVLFVLTLRNRFRR